MAEITIDAENAVAGRLASFAAKQALLGFTVNIVNCEKAIISGDKYKTTARYHYRNVEMGQPHKGPFIPKMPDRFVRRIVRGMLGHKRGRGRDAFKRVMCYIGVPEEMKGKDLVRAEKGVEALPRLRYVTVGDLCRSMGGKI